MKLPETRRQYCSFHLGGLLCGIAVDAVQEIIRYQEITPVPLASREICGLINLRGQIVTAIDLRYLMELPARDGEALPMNVIVRTRDGGFSLLVDRIGDVLTLDLAMAEPPPPTLRSAAGEFIEHAYKLEAALLLALDMPCLVRRITAGSTAA